MVERLRTLWSSEKSMAALSVEPLPVLMVEHLKVLSRWSSPAGGILSSPLPYGRAPKGDGGQSSLLPHPYQSSPVGPLPDGRAPKGPLQFT